MPESRLESPMSILADEKIWQCTLFCCRRALDFSASRPFSLLCRQHTFSFDCKMVWPLTCLPWRPYWNKKLMTGTRLHPSLRWKQADAVREKKLQKRAMEREREREEEKLEARRLREVRIAPLLPLFIYTTSLYLRCTHLFLLPSLCLWDSGFIRSEKESYRSLKQIWGGTKKRERSAYVAKQKRASPGL